MQIKTSYILAIAATSLLSFSACKSKKNLTTTNDNNTPVQVNKLEDYYKHKIEYNSFNGKMSLSYDDGKMDQKASANLKMNKGKDVWLLASAVGGMIEVARSYATPDSLQAMVGLTKTAYRMKFDDGIKKLGVAVDFETLQNLFIGNPLITNGKVQKSREQGKEVILSFLQDGYELDVYYDKATGYINKQTLNNRAKNFSCEILHQNYQALADKQPFSMNRTITINDNGKKINTKIDFSKAEINTPAIINFKIPGSYKEEKL